MCNVFWHFVPYQAGLMFRIAVCFTGHFFLLTHTVRKAFSYNIKYHVNKAQYISLFTMAKSLYSYMSRQNKESLKKKQ